MIYMLELREGLNRDVRLVNVENDGKDREHVGFGAMLRKAVNERKKVRGDVNDSVRFEWFCKFRWGLACKL